MLKAVVLVLASVLAGPAMAAPGALELDFGTSDSTSGDGFATTHLDLAAELPLSSEFAVGLAASNARRDQTGATSQTLAFGLAPAWHLSEDLRMGAYYERHRLGTGASAPDADAWGLEAGYRPSDPVQLSGYLGRFGGASAGTPETTTWGISARTSLNATYLFFAFFQREVSDGGWWEGRGAGLTRSLDDRGLGLSMRYTEREAPDGVRDRILFFGGTIKIGKATASTPEFRARHCVSCISPE